MKNILIICFSDRFELLMLSNLVSSVYSQSVDANISLCVYKEDYYLVKDLKYVTKHFVLDKEKIIKIKTSKRIPEFHALNYFTSFVNELKNYCWDYVYNISNDELAVFLTSFLDSKNFGGKKISKNNTISNSSNWTILESMFSTYNYSSIHRIDLWHKIMDVTWKNYELKINTDPECNKYMAQLLTNYRDRVSLFKKGCKIVAVLVDDYDKKNTSLPEEIVGGLIEELIGDSDFHPVLIHTTDIDNELKKRYENKFADKILVKELDARGLSSFLINVDVLVTADGIAQAIANLLNTTTVRVLLNGNENIYNVGPIHTGDVVIKYDCKGRFKQDKLARDELARDKLARDELGVCDLLLGIQIAVENISPKRSIIPSPNIYIYQTLRDKMGIWYRPVFSEMDMQKQITILMSRLFIMRVFENDSSIEILNYIISFYDREQIYTWIDQERDQILLTAKILLDTNRNLKLVSKLHGAGAVFVKNLEILLGFSSSEHLVSIPSNVFKQRVDSIASNGMDDNIREVELILNEFKTHLQILTTTLTDLTFLEYTKRGGNFIDKVRF